VHAAHRFGEWLSKQGLPLSAVSDQLISRYIDQFHKRIHLELDTNEVFLFREETSRKVLIEFLKGGAVRAAFGTFDHFLTSSTRKTLSGSLEVIDVDYCKRLERERGAKPYSRAL
jgi:hypothetical protein